jgi:hypothetical protein
MLQRTGEKLGAKEEKQKDLWLGFVLRSLLMLRVWNISKDNDDSDHQSNR